MPRLWEETVAAHRRAVEDAILDAAAALVNDHGLLSVTMSKIAEQTGGMAYSAEDAPQLRKVFANLPKDVTVQKQPREMTAPFVALGAILAALAIGASIRWSAYP